MKHFTYFMERKNNPSLDELHKAGLGYAFPRGDSFTTKNVLHGPERIPGALLAHGEGADPKFDSESQLWFPITTRDTGCWLGLPKDRSQWPGPDNLRRAKVSLRAESVSVLLGDENLWSVPIARFAGGDTSLPACVVNGPDGKPRWRVVGEHVPLVNMALKVLDDAFELKSDCTPDFLLALGSAALRVNYRLDQAEVSALELLDTTNIGELVRALLDADNLQKLLEEAKKN